MVSLSSLLLGGQHMPLPQFTVNTRLCHSSRPLDASPRSRCVSSGIEDSRRARIPSPLVEPPVLVLWLNKVTQQFCSEPPQTPRADSGREPLPCTGSCARLRLALIPTMQPALNPIRPPGPSSRAYLSLHSSEAPQS
jgi:hypothetical protein